MESLVSIFHIDIKLFVAQLINFALIFLILYKFAFKPISKIMQERTATIEKSLVDAKEVEKKMVEANSEQTRILNEAKKDAAQIVDNANQSAENNRQKLIEQTKIEVAAIMVNEKAKIAQEKSDSLKEIKQEMAELVVLAVEKVIKEKMTDAKDRELIAESIKK
ncbi:MAG: F0F1 ATP synthase subunit B [Patescibacteria group bacterium]|jgi:F-type H+-transporting ATPase subunit b